MIFYSVRPLIDEINSLYNSNWRDFGTWLEFELELFFCCKRLDDKKKIEVEIVKMSWFGQMEQMGVICFYFLFSFSLLKNN